jgi:hypothetical protein
MEAWCENSGQLSAISHQQNFLFLLSRILAIAES